MYPVLSRLFECQLTHDCSRSSSISSASMFFARVQSSTESKGYRAGACRAQAGAVEHSVSPCNAWTAPLGLICRQYLCTEDSPHLLEFYHFLICHSKRCHRPRTSSSHKVQVVATAVDCSKAFVTAWVRGSLCNFLLWHITKRKQHRLQ